jgi:hypothetical protein
MNFVKETGACFKTEVDLFSIPPIQTAVEHGAWDEISPINNDKSDGSIEFRVFPTSDYIDLSETQLYIKCAIRKKDSGAGINIKEADKIGPINNFLHSMFNQVSLSLDNKIIENSNGSYAYRAYIENLLCYSKNAKQTHLRSCLFEEDTPGQFDNEKIKYTKAEIDALTDTQAKTSTENANKEQVNNGLHSRRQPFVKNGFVELFAPIHIDMFNSNKYLLPGISMVLSFYRSRPNFCLIGTKGNEDYFVHIEKASLYVRRVKIAPSIVEQHMRGLQSDVNAKYPIRRVVVKALTLNKDTVSECINNISKGQVPRRLIVGFVKHTAYSGSWTENPFNFTHFNIKKMILNIGGSPAPFLKGLRFDYDNNEYMLGYSTIFKGLYKGIYENGNSISYNEYPNGNNLYVFNLTPDHCDDEHVTFPQTGDVTLDVEFSKALVNNISAIFYLEYDNMVEINKLNNIICDYQT